MLKKLMFIVVLGMAFGMSHTAFAGANPCNPCSMDKMKHNPCNMNLCDMKQQHKMNPCNPCNMDKMKHNPCSMNPCGMKKHDKMNPCAMNPCAMDDTQKKIRSGSFKSFSEAATVGKKMWQDETLGKSGLACLSCHADYDNLNLGKRQNYPHYVEMVDDVVTLDQMVNYCMLNPMQGEQFAPNSKEMTALAAYFRAYRMKYLQDNQ